MRSSRHLSIELPTSMADDVRARVASGKYASESEVVRDGLRALADREDALEGWLKGPVVRAYDALKAGTLTTINLEDYREEIARERAAHS